MLIVDSRYHHPGRKITDRSTCTLALHGSDVREYVPRAAGKGGGGGLKQRCGGYGLEDGE